MRNLKNADEESKSAWLWRLAQYAKLIEVAAFRCPANQCAIATCADEEKPAEDEMIVPLLMSLALESHSIYESKPTGLKRLAGEALLASLRALMNVTNECDLGCRAMRFRCGSDEKKIVVAAALNLLSAHAEALLRLFDQEEEEYDDDDDDDDDVENGDERELTTFFHFDATITLLGVLINSVEEDGANRALFAAKVCDQQQGVGGVETVVRLMLDSLPPHVVNKEPPQMGTSIAAADEEEEYDDDDDEKWTVSHLCLSAYVCLLLGCLIRSSPRNTASVLKLMPYGARRLITVVQVLRAFLGLQQDAKVLTEEALRPTERVIEEMHSLLAKSQPAVKSPTSQLCTIVEEKEEKPPGLTGIADVVLDDDEASTNIFQHLRVGVRSVS